MLFVYAYTNHMQSVYDLYIFCIYHVQIIYTLYTICICLACAMCESYAMCIVFTYDIHIICIWVAYHYMLTAFYVHMINIRSTYDLHTIYIDYCYDLHGLPARLTPTCLAGPPHARGEGRKNLNCDRYPPPMLSSCEPGPHGPPWTHEQMMADGYTLSHDRNYIIEDGIDRNRRHWSRIYRRLGVFFFMPHAYRPPPLGNFIWVGTGRVVVIDGVNIGSFLQHVWSFLSHCFCFWSFIVAAILLKTNFLIASFVGIVFFKNAACTLLFGWGQGGLLL